MDERVLEVQRWLNKTYGGRAGFNEVTEDGITGWKTVYRLIRALQFGNDNCFFQRQ
ncbi:hypothetical protein FB379_14014 [Aeribacillus composti]|uniref:hypothetical protein n=1 Tax=Aeribacillus composti TaxID=1868734 RepID=UPI00119AA2D7|nr:hypothetical protein [Aeribacillus composti]MED0716784.1 hypothetical protein [Aeribacillus composti]MED0747472.1 hypothetical protein [Aeribacillus composti]MED1437207.1 hypothetical protein [Aeribacillus composti]TVZ76219.1 hypothetical protein FB379_14014 [Aeribacillus composti]